MARNLYPGTFVQYANGLPAATQPFTILTDVQGGDDVTSQLKSADETSAYLPSTTGSGNSLPFRGPDGYEGALFLFIGGEIRNMLISPTALDTLRQDVDAISSAGAGSGVADGTVTAAKLANGSVTTAKLADGAVTFLKTTGLVSEAMLSSYLPSPAGLEQLQDLIDGFLQGGVYDDAGNKYQLPAGASPVGTPTVSVAAYASAGSLKALTPWSAGMTAAQINTMLDNNDAIINAARLANPGKRIVGPEWHVPSHLDWTSVNFDCDLRLMHISAFTDGTGTVSPKPAMTVANPNGAAQAITVGTRSVGTTSASAGMYAETVSTLTLPTNAGASDTRKRQGDYARYRAGDAVQIASKDAYPWADQAIDGNTADKSVWRSEYGVLHGVLGAVTSVDFSGLANLNSPQTIERRKIRNSSGSWTAVVNAWSFDSGSTTSGTAEFASVPGDLISGEQLFDVDTGSLIGVAGAMTLTLFGQLENTYLTTPKMFKVDKTVRAVGTIKVRSNDDPELQNKLRSPSLDIAAPWWPSLDIRVDDVGSRGLILKAPFMGQIKIEAWGISNHALNGSNPYAESGYGYGWESRGPAYGTRISGGGGNLRHWGTSNPNQVTFEADSTKHLDYGCGGMFLRVHDAHVMNTFSAGLDLHSGAYRTRYDSCSVSFTSGAGLWLTASYGCQDRGIGTEYNNVEVTGATVAFLQGGAPLQAGLKHQPTYRNCRAIDYQVRGWLVLGFLDAAGVAQDGTTQLGTYAKVVLENCFARGDGGAAAQAGFELQHGVYELNGIRSERFSLMPMWIKGYAPGGAGTQSIGGRHVWRNLYFDYTESGGTNPTRLDTQLELLRIIGPIGGMSKGSTAPSYVLRSTTGKTIVQHEGIAWSSALDTENGLAARPQLLEVTGGTATAVDTRGLGGSSVPQHSTTVAPTVAAGVALGTTPSGISLATTPIASTDLYGEVVFGTDPTAAGSANTPLFRVTFGTPFQTLPKVRTSAGNAAMAGRAQTYCQMDTTVDIDLTGFSVRCAGNLAPAQGPTGYRVVYQVEGV